MNGWAGPVFLVMVATYQVAIIIRAILLWRNEGINPFVVGQTRTGLGRWLESIFPWVGLIWTVDVVLTATDAPLRLFPWFLERPLFHSLLAERVGLALVGIAVLLFLAALAAFGNSWRIGIDRENPGSLVTTGVFAYTRNPIFLSMDLILLGTFLVVPSIIYLLAMCFIFIAIHFQVLEEEKFLRSEHGEVYEEYVRQTCRYLGRKRTMEIRVQEPTSLAS
ncbi:isoprenylcysteine carboxylmethyltransferase family protein [bacterium]|nr:isoprenylcysteine carboxylmethyltransferase family protein [bacterium]